MVIDTTKECSRRILANIFDKQVSTSRVFINEVRDIMDESSNDNQGALERLFAVWQGGLARPHQLERVQCTHSFPS